MVAVLRRKKLLLGCELTVNLLNIENSPFGARHRVEIRRQVGEGHEGLALRKRDGGPIRRQPQQPGGGQSPSRRLPATDVFRHGSPPGDDRSSGLRKFYILW